MKIRVTKEFPFEMAHALYAYDGPCKDIHGHSYRLLVTVIGETEQKPDSPKQGMVMDFKDLKQIVKANLIDVFDHALVLNANSPHRELKNLEPHFERILWVNYQPTCENLLIDFQDRIRAKMTFPLRIVAMRLHETATAFAEWKEEDNI